jgi:type 1 glutamine amidotransferase
MTRPQLWSIAALVPALLPAALPGLGRAGDNPRPIRALLVIGGGFHDYAKQKDILTKGIAARAHVVWTVAYDPNTGTRHKNPVYDDPNWANNFEVVVHDECCSEVKDPEVINRILEPHRQGLPAVVLHCGMHSYRSAGWPKTTPWFEFTGLATTGHGPQVPIAVSFIDKESPITKGLGNWTTIKEELYNNSSGKLLDTAHALVRGKQTTKDKAGKVIETDYVVAWTNLYKVKARVFATTLGHNNETVADPRYLDLVTRGLLWSVGKLDDSHLKSGRKASP